MPTATPTYDVDLFTDEAIAEPYDHYRELRDRGPAVWLEAHDAFALPRYAEVREALGDHGTFCSGEGVALNDFANTAARGGTLMSDGDLHAHLRSVVAHRLTPHALRELQPGIERMAADVADRIVEQRVFDGVTDVAQALPLAVVPDLLGWREDARPNLLRWAAAAFESFGPLNRRVEQALPAIGELVAFAERTSTERDLLPGSLGADLLDAASRGEIRHDQCPVLLLDYLTPALDTTISALGAALWLFATHPEQWDVVRADPSMAGPAFNEVVRWQSPIRLFSRLTTREIDVGGSTIPSGTRVLMMFASANRDERQWHRPDGFDVTRDARAHLGFGYGVHYCAGQGLARLESTALLAALAARVERFHLEGEPTLALNNVIRAFGSVPLRIDPA